MVCNVFASGFSKTISEAWITKIDNEFLPSQVNVDAMRVDARAPLRPDNRASVEKHQPTCTMESEEISLLASVTITAITVKPVAIELGRAMRDVDSANPNKK